MGALGVVPEEPIDHFQVERRDIISQESTIEHDEVLGDRSIEPLNEGVLLRGTDMGIEVHETEDDTGVLEVLGELAPIVRLELVNLERTDLDDSPEEISG